MKWLDIQKNNSTSMSLNEIVSIYESLPYVVKNYLNFKYDNLVIIPIYVHIPYLYYLREETCDVDDIILNNPFPGITISHNVNKTVKILIYNSWEYLENGTHIHVNANLSKIIKKLSYPINDTIISFCGMDEGKNFPYFLMRSWNLDTFFHHNLNLFRKERFLFLNRKYRFERLLLFSLLVKSNLLDYCFTSFLEIPSEDAYDKLSQHLHPQNVIVDKVRTKLTKPLQLDIEGNWTTLNGLYNYMNLTIMIIVETLPVLEADTFITEKTTKPLLSGIPFIIFARHKYLSKLKKLGFYTFSPYINESYDDISDPFQRLQAIIKEIKRISELPFHTYREIFNSLHTVFEHNRNHFLYLSTAKLPIDFIKLLVNE